MAIWSPVSITQDLFRNLQATLLSSMDGDPEEGNKTSFGCLKGLMLDVFFGGKYVAIWEDVKLKQQDVSCDTTNCFESI